MLVLKLTEDENLSIQQAKYAILFFCLKRSKILFIYFLFRVIQSFSSLLFCFSLLFVMFGKKIPFPKNKIFLYLDRFTMRRERRIPDYLNQNKPSLIILPKGIISYFVLFSMNLRKSVCLLIVIDHGDIQRDINFLYMSLHERSYDNKSKFSIFKICFLQKTKFQCIAPGIFSIIAIKQHHSYGAILTY